MVRGNIQLASQPLVPMEQFATGGINSVRGYRQDLLLTDNGLFLSAEYQLPILSIPESNSVVQLILLKIYCKNKVYILLFVIRLFSVGWFEGTTPKKDNLWCWVSLRLIQPTRNFS